MTEADVWAGIDYQKLRELMREVVSSELEEKLTTLWSKGGEAYQRHIEKLTLPYFSRHPTGIPLYIEDWSYGRAYSVTTSGDGGYEVVTASDVVGQPNVFNGKSMCKISTPGTGTAAGTGIYYDIMPLNSLRLGMEVNFASWYIQTQLPTAFDYLTLAAIRLHKDEVTPTPTLQPSIIYWPYDDSLRLANCGAPWPGQLLLSKVFGTHYFTSWFLFYHNLKFIVDFETEKPVKLYFNDREIDLSSYTMDRLAPVHANPLLQFFVGARDQGTQSYLFIGNMFFTMEEP